MNIFLGLTGACFGLIIGSFLNVVIIRGKEGSSLNGRSQCVSCKTTLSPLELIPVVSFLIQKGRCRSCGTALSIQYPLVEFGTAIIFTIFLLSYPVSFTIQSILASLIGLTGVSTAIVILASDIRYHIIPNWTVLVLCLIGILTRIYINPESLASAAVTAIILSLIFGSLWFISKGRWMGLGDAKLTLATSLILGYPLSITAFLFSLWLGGIFGLLLLVSGRRKLQDRLAFGPFILAGSVLSLLWGNAFLLYMGLSEIFL